MWNEQQIRDRMGLADPARAVPVAPAAVSATELIARAEAGVVVPVARRPLPPRRRLLAAAAAGFVVAAVAAYGLVQPARDRPAEQLIGSVAVPIAYQIADDPPPAGDHLRDLAARITDAPHDGQTGPYSYHRIRTWNAWSIAISEVTIPDDSDEYAQTDVLATAVDESETWAAADGSGRMRGRIVGLEFPDEESRTAWNDMRERELIEELAEFVSGEPAGTLHPFTELPTDREGLIELLDYDDGATDFFAVEELYRHYVVPRPVRAAILEILADAPDLEWRGEVTDRAGRAGVAVTQDDEAGQDLLVFDPQTGELLAREYLDLRPDDLAPDTEPQDPAVAYYGLFLETGWTTDPGPEPTEVGPFTPEPTDPAENPDPTGPTEDPVPVPTAS
jgi:hypothetical protein